MTEPRRLCVGRIDRAHGLRGELIVTLTTNRTERIAPKAVLYTASQRALTIVASQPHGTRFIVRIEGVDDRQAADALHGVDLYADAIDDPDELWVHDLVGAAVFDQHGIERGRVVEVTANPASDLLVLDTGALVPARFVRSLVPNERVDVDVPEGLFEDLL